MAVVLFRGSAWGLLVFQAFLPLGFTATLIIFGVAALLACCLAVPAFKSERIRCRTQTGPGLSRATRHPSDLGRRRGRAARAGHGVDVRPPRPRRAGFEVDGTGTPADLRATSPLSTAVLAPTPSRSPSASRAVPCRSTRRSCSLRRCRPRGVTRGEFVVVPDGLEPQLGTRRHVPVLHVVRLDRQIGQTMIKSRRPPAASCTEVASASVASSTSARVVGHPQVPPTRRYSMFQAATPSSASDWESGSKYDKIVIFEPSPTVHHDDHRVWAVAFR